MTNENAEHLFGGAWTDLKLRAIAEYLQFYTSALKAQPSAEKPFETWYIDAFAGSGERTEYREVGDLISGVPIGREKVRIEGSARRAIKVTPPFRHLVFVEQHRRRYNALKALASEFPQRNIQPLRGDSNEELRKIFTAWPWVGGASGLQRGVVFLDPYGMNVKWETFQLLASTKRVDVWYLFPLHAVLRQLARDLAAVDAAKTESLNEIFGRSDWEADLYRARSAPADLFDYQPSGKERIAGPKEVEAYFKVRLQSLFPFVSDPVPLLTGKGLQQFSLFCACANPAKPAQDLIKKGVDHVVRKYTPASRRKSFP
jgi:three-Cys-motif partner protein